MIFNFQGFRRSRFFLNESWSASYFYEIRFRLSETLSLWFHISTKYVFGLSEFVTVGSDFYENAFSFEWGALSGFGFLRNTFWFE